MAVIGHMFDYGIVNLYTKQISLTSDTIKLALLDSTKDPGSYRGTWQKFSDLTSEVVGTGYTTGGATLTNVSVTPDTTNHWVIINADDVSWPTSTITARYGILYDSTATNSPLIAYIDFGQDYVSNAGDLKITWDAAGIVKTTT